MPVSGGVPGCSHPERPLSRGASETLSPTGGETRDQGIAQTYRGERADTCWATNSQLRRRAVRFSKKSHLPRNKRQHLSVQHIMSMPSSITNPNPPKSQSSQSPLGMETNHHQHIHMVLLVALRAKTPLSHRALFLKSQKCILKSRWCNRPACPQNTDFHGEQENDVDRFACSGAFDCSA